MEGEIKKAKKKIYLGWISLIAAFAFFPIGAIIGIILAVLALTQKDHDHTIPKVALLFAGAILLIFILMTFGLL